MSRIPCVLGRDRLAFLAPLLIALSSHVVGARAANAADSIYWSAEGGNAIRVANLDGSGTASSLFGGEGGPCGVAIDPAAGKIYWANFNSGGLRVGNLDGSGSAATAFDSGRSLCGVAVYPAANKMYWADFGNNEIRVGNLDGSGSASALFVEPGGSAPSGVAIDPAAGKIYWTNQFSDEVRVGNLDGTGSASTLFGSEDNPIGVAIDAAAGKLYWTDLNSGLVRIGNQDGSGMAANLFAGEIQPGGVALDPAANKIYWDSFSPGVIRVANLDGSGTASPLFSGEGSPLFVALLRAPEGTGVPTVSGGSSVGDELTCSQGTWAADLLGAFLFRAPRTFAYQWQKDSIDIGGETAVTYTTTEAGNYTCRVTATNQAGSTPQTSAAHVVSEPTATPTRTATATATATLTATATRSATPTATATGASTATTTATTTRTGTATKTSTSTASPTVTPTFTPGGIADAATPVAGCRTPGRSLLYVKNQSKLKWTWFRSDTSFAELGDPVNGSTSYLLCIYDETAGVPNLKLGASAPADGMCGTRPCWKQLGSTNPKGFKYKDLELTPNGLSIIALKSGDSGRAKIILRGKGANLPAVMSFTQDTDVIVQLVKSGGGVCWESVFSAPAPRNSGGLFKDTFP